MPSIIDSLDNEAKGWADTVHVLVHNLLDNGCLSRIVQATVQSISKQAIVVTRIVYSMRILISLSFNLAFLKIDSILVFAGEC